MKPVKKPKRAQRSEVRLLPAVIAIGVILFALKAGGLAFTANAAPAPEAKPAANAAKPSAAGTAKPGAAAPAAKANDPLAAINAALPVPAKTAQPAEAPKAADELSADLDASGVSAAEMDVLTSLSDRRDALEQRQRDLDLRANIIAATEKRVDGKIGELKTLQTKIEALLGQLDAKQLEQLDGLVKVYTAMKPKDAARIFAALDDTVRLGVAGRMKPDVVAGIMAALPPETAQKLSVELASRYKVPAPAAADAAVAGAPAAAAPTPASVASAAPAPPAAPGK
jgi:flagellar motility protein MotE (MotC chaperone)